MMEGDVMRAVMLEAGSDPNCRVFRNNTGLGWVGEVVKQTPDILILKNWRPLHAGLVKGAGDLVGWRSVEITPDMVGKRLAVFTSIEVKTAKGRVSDEQKNFIRVVNEAGGIAGVARSKEDAKDLIK